MINADKTLVRTLLQYLAGYTTGAALTLCCGALTESHLPLVFIDMILLGPIRLFAGPLDSNADSKLCLEFFALTFIAAAVLAVCFERAQSLPTWMKRCTFRLAVGFVLGVIGSCAFVGYGFYKPSMPGFIM